MDKIYDLCPKCFASLQEFITERLPNVGQTYVQPVPLYTNPPTIAGDTTTSPTWTWTYPTGSFSFGSGSFPTSTTTTTTATTFPTTTITGTYESWMETVKKQTGYQLSSITGKDVK